MFSSCRASRNRNLGLALHWLLYTEWEDDVFGPRVQRTHVAFQAAAESAQVEHSLSCILFDATPRQEACHAWDLAHPFAARDLWSYAATAVPSYACSFSFLQRNLEHLGQTCPPCGIPAQRRPLVRGPGECTALTLANA